MGEQHRKPVCPRCGSEEIMPVRRVYDAGLGCLGLVLVGWVGLLAGLLGGGSVDLCCMNCGYQWRPGLWRGTSCGGCLFLIIILIVLSVFFGKVHAKDVSEMKLSVHNSQSELVITRKMVAQAGLRPLTFTGKNGMTLPYRQLVVGADQPGDFALMIFFHGAGSVGNDNYTHVRIPGMAIARYLVRHKNLKAVVVFPQCRKGHRWVEVPWGDPAHDMPSEPSVHMQLAMELLDSKLREFPVDPKRIYAGGISMGGYGAWDIVSRRPELFAAIFAICGGADEKQAPKLRNLAVCDYHGDADKVVPVSRSRNMIEALRKQGNDRILYRELPGVNHNAWDPAFADDTALDFIFSQTKR